MDRKSVLLTLGLAGTLFNTGCQSVSAKASAEADGWYMTLKEDSAGQEKWYDAAAHIVERGKELPVNGKLTLPADYKPVTTMNGESLREKQDPSVTELIAKRASPSPTDEVSTARLHDLSQSCRMALMLHRWEPEAALPTLTEVSRKSLKVVDGPLKDYSQIVNQSFCRTISARLSLKDEPAIEDYQKWLKGTTIQHFSEPLTFLPLWAHQDFPGVRELATWTFSSPDSPWAVAQHATPSRGVSHLTNLIDSPALMIDAFREALGEQLKNEDVIGECWLMKGGVRWTMSTGGGSGGRAFPYPAPGLKGAVLDKHVPLRVCDFLGWWLSYHLDAPEFVPVWSTAEKDKALELLLVYLEEKGAAAGESMRDKHQWREDVLF